VCNQRTKTEYLLQETQAKKVDKGMSEITELAVRSLDRLIGTWELSGDASGTVTYEWLDGGFFMVQRVDLELFGSENKGIEVIGHEKGFGVEEPSEDIKSRFYGNRGETFDYIYELEGDTLTIWGGEKGSPAYYKGTFSEDDSTLSGGWHWPGGGYNSVATRVK